ncbi:MAG: AarF/UbiB family protein, partial [Fuerstiella sp.]
MRGLPQKLGQMLSFSLGHEEQAVDQYATLQQGAEPLALEVVRPVMEAAWGCPLEDVLSDIDPAAYAASLGQVHRTTLRDGRAVAIKVQYPGIRDTVM